MPIAKHFHHLRIFLSLFLEFQFTLWLFAISLSSSSILSTLSCNNRIGWVVCCTFWIVRSYPPKASSPWKIQAPRKSLQIDFQKFSPFGFGIFKSSGLLDF
jgi:hypothetical protein